MTLPEDEAGDSGTSAWLFRDIGGLFCSLDQGCGKSAAHTDLPCTQHEGQSYCICNISLQWYAACQNLSHYQVPKKLKILLISQSVQKIDRHRKLYNFDLASDYMILPEFESFFVVVKGDLAILLRGIADLSCSLLHGSCKSAEDAFRSIQPMLQLIKMIAVCYEGHPWKSEQWMACKLSWSELSEWEENLDLHWQGESACAVPPYLSANAVAELARIQPTVNELVGAKAFWALTRELYHRISTSCWEFFCGILIRQFN